MEALIVRSRSQVSFWASFGLFQEASGGDDGGKLAGNVLRLDKGVGTLPENSFEAANTITGRLLKKGWRYDLPTYRLTDMFKRKAGNCLGLSCFYGALLQDRGFNPEYELVIGPKAFQSKDEQELLDFMLCGQAFPFHSPVLPERPEKGDKLLFATQEHPRLILDGQRFETTALQEQEPSSIGGERIRKLTYGQLAGLVYYERAYAERANKEKADRLLLKALDADPDNNGVFAHQADIALSDFDDSALEKACEKHANAKVSDSKSWLQRYSLFGNEADLDRALKANPTEMRAWPLKNVIHEKDAGNRRYNFAIAAQCIARSEILNLGNFYACYADTLAKMFPDHAVGLVKKSRDKATNAFEHHLALAILGSCKKVPWVGSDKPFDHLAKAAEVQVFLSPLQKTRWLLAAKRLSQCSGAWDEHKSRFNGLQTFRAVVDSMESQWGSL